MRRSVQSVAALAAQDYDCGGAEPHERRAREVSPWSSSAPRCRSRRGGTTIPSCPATMIVALAMEVLWVGLERARAGERYAGPG